MRKIDLRAVAAEDITAPASIVTPMPEPVVIPESLKKSLGDKPDAMWIYRMADGAAFGAVGREVKGQVSHRARAFTALLAALEASPPRP